MCEADCVAMAATRPAVMVGGGRPEQKRLYIFAPECSLGCRTLDATGRFGPWSVASDITAQFLLIGVPGASCEIRDNRIEDIN
jgi:hypothetical protein